MGSSDQVYRVEAFSRFDWLEHWFGTRHSQLPLPGANLATLHQIHSRICVPAEGRSGQLGEGDALVSDTRGQLIAVKTADCLPLLIADERRHAVAAVHAGWRGTVLGVAVAAVQSMGELFSSRREDLHVAIGPGIGVCCYEVGPEVAARFQEIFPERDMSVKLHLDLAEANRRLLTAAGVNPGQIYSGAPCTFCGHHAFYSYRRDKEKAGRMLSGIGLKL